LTNSTVTTGTTATYDAEGRVQTITGLPAGTIRYYYDGNGNRVMKVICGTSACTPTTSGAQLSLYVYDAMGQLAVEYAPRLR
jgi:YD repeat-containing protein